jgi:hypothetical protein
MATIQFDEEAHRYTYEGRVIPSVTQVISAVLPGAFQAGEWYLQRGRAVHACAAFIAQGVSFKSDPQIAGQVQAIQRFFDEVKPEVISCEEKMVSSLYRFAGTPDLVCKIGKTTMIIDFKASCEANRLALQLGGYSVLYEATRKKTINNGRGVIIKSDGTYSMTNSVNLRNARREFLAIRTVYAIQERMCILPRKEEK